MVAVADDDDEEEEGPKFRVGDAVVDGRTGEVGQIVAKTTGWWKIQIPSSDKAQSRRSKELTAPPPPEAAEDDEEEEEEAAPPKRAAPRKSRRPRKARRKTRRRSRRRSPRGGRREAGHRRPRRRRRARASEARPPPPPRRLPRRTKRSRASARSAAAPRKSPRRARRTRRRTRRRSRRAGRRGARRRRGRRARRRAREEEARAKPAREEARAGEARSESAAGEARSEGARQGERRARAQEAPGRGARRGAQARENAARAGAALGPLGRRVGGRRDDGRLGRRGRRQGGAPVPRGHGLGIHQRRRAAEGDRPDARAWHASVASASRLVVFGGDASGDGRPVRDSTARVFDIDEGEWTAEECAARPQARLGHALLSLRDSEGQECVAALGGLRGRDDAITTTCDALQKRLKIKGSVPKGEAPKPHAHGCAVVLRNGAKAVVWTGRPLSKGDKDTPSNKVFVLERDAAGDAWTWTRMQFVMGDKPSFRSKAACCLLPDGISVLVHGGLDEDTGAVLGDAFILDTRLWEWSRAPKRVESAFGARAGHSLALRAGRRRAHAPGVRRPRGRRLGAGGPGQGRGGRTDVQRMRRAAEDERRLLNSPLPDVSVFNNTSPYPRPRRGRRCSAATRRSGWSVRPPRVR